MVEVKGWNVRSGWTLGELELEAGSRDTSVDGERDGTSTSDEYKLYWSNYVQIGLLVNIIYGLL